MQFQKNFLWKDQYYREKKKIPLIFPIFFFHLFPLSNSKKKIAYSAIKLFKCYMLLELEMIKKKRKWKNFFSPIIIRSTPVFFFLVVVAISSKWWQWNFYYPLDDFHDDVRTICESKILLWVKYWKKKMMSWIVGGLQQQKQKKKVNIYMDYIGVRRKFYIIKFETI